jgi:DNA-binding IclR family transcriptional regulator
VNLHQAVDDDDLMASKPLTKLQKYSAPALEKGLDILELLSLTATEMSLSAIAAGVGRSKNEIFRMMIVLEERQFINRRAGDFYDLTDRLAVLGANRSKHNRLAEVAMPVLAGLAEKTLLSCHLSVLLDGDVLVVAQADTAKSYSISVPVGHRRAMAECSAGVSILRASMQDSSPETDEKGQGRDGGEISGQRARSKLESEIIEMPHPELSGISELSASILSISNGCAIAAFTIPFMTAAISGDQKSAVKSYMLESTQLMEQRVAILLPQY